MKQILAWSLISGLSFLIFLLFLVLGIARKNKRNIFISLVLFLVAIPCGLYAVFLVANKSVKKISEVFKPRPGIEIYTALFDKPEYGCVEVVNEMDQIVPRLDCCIWLEFKTCPNELSRIINRESLIRATYQYSDTSEYLPSYSPRPAWWRPLLLGDSSIVLQKYDSNDPNRDKILVFSKDSTHAFYCDMTD